VARTLKADAFKLAVSVLVCQMAGVIGSVFTAPAIPGWYATLSKPGFTPPNWIFGPAWITLYTLMGISAFIVWRKGWDIGEVRTALRIFVAQLILNALWSAAFFGLRSPLAGFLAIALLWMLILLTMAFFRKVSLAASVLLLPYLLWVSYASVLNFSIWRLNT
jgi:benzodiazapine receptor